MNKFHDLEMTKIILKKNILIGTSTPMIQIFYSCGCIGYHNYRKLIDVKNEHCENGKRISLDTSG
jgi:hypothetical protein